jgi:predicted O-methyltransferase YrrM
VTATELLADIYASGKVEAADGTLVDAFPRAIPRRHADVIGRVVRELGLMRTLEIGLGFGLGTLAICAEHQARGEGSHITIDPLQSTVQRSIGVLNIRRAGVEEYVRVIEERSDVALPRLREEGVRLDFAFVDGRHVFDVVMLDFVYVDLMLEVGGVVALHDTWMRASSQVEAYVRRNRAYELIAAPLGMAVLRKVGDDHRAWDYHRDFGFDPRDRGRQLRDGAVRLARRMGVLRRRW